MPPPAWPFPTQSVRRAPEVFEHVDQIDDDAHSPERLGHLSDDPDLVLVPIDQHDPLAPMLRITWKVSSMTIRGSRSMLAQTRLWRTLGRSGRSSAAREPSRSASTSSGVRAYRAAV